MNNKKNNNREWEKFYKNRNQYDKVVRSTHGVNCTGSCSWNIYVKNGIVINELQANDYPRVGFNTPSYDPRGCPRGASYSWYQYSPLRIKFPYIRGILLDLWNEALKADKDIVNAWASIVEDKEKLSSFQRARGMGGLRRVSWETAREIITASTIYTIKKYGADRITGFSPIPAMSQISYAAGTRFLQLLGGSCLSFYDWYCDLPAASPETWGEQTDVSESADWYNSMYTVVMGSNVSMTRTPDAHFLTESRYKGTKVVVLSPDYSQVAKHSDVWLPIEKGQDAAFWLAVNHVILKEYFTDNKNNYFDNYVKKYSDLPFLVKLKKEANGVYSTDRFLRCSDVTTYELETNANWKMLIFDEETNSLYAPNGTLGYRWQENKGFWNLEDTDSITGMKHTPLLSITEGDEVEILCNEFKIDNVTPYTNKIKAKLIETKDGQVYVATVFDLLRANLGVELNTDKDILYNKDIPYTPKWQEKYTGIDAQTVVQIAREFADNALKTKGKSMIIIGAGVNQWYNSDLSYRAAIYALILCGCVGVNGGGLAHYVGQEKVAMISSWSTIAFGKDYARPPRLQNTTSFWYIHANQYKYEDEVFEYYQVPDKNNFTEHHSADFNAKAVRLGHLPFYPQFNKNPMNLAEEALSASNGDKQQASMFIAEQLENGSLKFAVEDPDAIENFPHLWFIWRGNAISSSAKGHEYFLKHVLGTTNSVTTQETKYQFKYIQNRETPSGKVDLIVDLNFRMDTSALYSDIILPSATWYEKNDLNTSDMHSFIHPMTAAVPPSWESLSDWDIFKSLAKSIQSYAPKYFNKPLKDVVSSPLEHDTPDEMAQEYVSDWKETGETPVPGKNMPKLTFVERDYSKLYDEYISLGSAVREKGLAIHGISWDAKEEYDELKEINGTRCFGDIELVDISSDIKVAEAILRLAPESNGNVAYKAFANLEKNTGRNLKFLAEGNKNCRAGFQDIIRQPRRILNSPCWSGIIENNRTYSPYTLNVECLIPWRTLTGRQQFYIDHEIFIKTGESFANYKPEVDCNKLNEIIDNNSITLNMISPHGKWNIHSTYFDNERMLTLSRGGSTIWISNEDAKLLSIQDNDWLDVSNQNGSAVCRAVVSIRIPKGMCIMYHAPERTINVPISPSSQQRGGIHNSLSRVRVKPILMAGGYAQFTYSFNYWGPIGVNRETFVNIKKISNVRF